MAQTQLTPSATPGRRYSFSPKDSAVKGSGLFTALSVFAVPGMRPVFDAKSPAISIPVPIGSRPAERGYPHLLYERDERDDQEIMELAAIIVKSGMI